MRRGAINYYNTIVSLLLEINVIIGTVLIEVYLPSQRCCKGKDLHLLQQWQLCQEIYSQQLISSTSFPQPGI